MVEMNPFHCAAVGLTAVHWYLYLYSYSLLFTAVEHIPQGRTRAAGFKEDAVGYATGILGFVPHSLAFCI